MKKSLRGLGIALCVASAAPTACSGDELRLGGGGNSPCEPGNYVGTFACTTGTDGSFPPFDASFATGFDASFPGNGGGAIVFFLQGDRGGSALTIAPSSKLSMPTMGTAGIMFVADLSGTLDCATLKLVGNLSNITVGTSAFTYSSKQPGDLSADYQPRSPSSPPQLVNGMMDLGSLSAPTFGFGAFITTCTWNAQLQP
jgi:hypothetical protein